MRKRIPGLMAALAMAALLPATPAAAQSTATGSVSITVTAPLAISSTAINCVVGQLCTGKLQATGGVAPYTWKISSGAPPSGFALNADGSFSWTPSGAVAGASITVTVTDSSGHSVTLNWQAPTGGTAVAEYQVYRGPSACGSLSALAMVNAPTTDYVDRAVAAGDSFCYGVTARSAAGLESPMSNKVTATVPAP